MIKTVSLYLVDAFDRKNLIDNAKRALADVDFDTLIGTGISGAIAVPTIADALGKAFGIVRKPNDSTHSMNGMEGFLGERWVFVDDFIESGETLKRVRKQVERVAAGSRIRPIEVGSYLYAVSSPPDYDLMGRFDPNPVLLNDGLV